MIKINFLYALFLTTITDLPILVVVGISGLAALISMVTSIFSYIVIKGTFISWKFVSIEIAGVFIGAIIGARTQNYIHEIWLKRICVILAVYVGIKYFNKGFFGQNWLPPFI